MVNASKKMDPNNPGDFLTVTDNRTGKTIEVPITNNAIRATAFKQLKAERKDGEREEDRALSS